MSEGNIAPSNEATYEQEGKNSMEDLVRYIAQNLVDKPDEVKVTTKPGDRSTVIELTVAPEDMGKVIGRQGRIAKAIRTVVKAASIKDNKKYVVEIL